MLLQRLGYDGLEDGQRRARWSRMSCRQGGVAAAWSEEWKAAVGANGGGINRLDEARGRMTRSMSLFHERNLTIVKWRKNINTKACQTLNYFQK